MISSDTFSSLGIGTSRIASLGNNITLKAARLLFSQALDSEVRVVDTADTYGSGDSERMIANAINGKRNDYFLITKAGFPYMSLPSGLSPLNQLGKKLYQNLNLKKNYSKQYLLKSIHKSLKRLKTDTVDTFLLHEPSFDELVKFPDFWEALAQIKKDGMAQFVGISTNDIHAFNLAVSKGPVDIVQTTLPYSGEDRSSVYYHSKKSGITVIANQVLRATQRLSEDIALNSKLNSLGISKRDIPSVLIAYSLQYKKADCILVGTRNPEHLKENAIAVNHPKELDLIFSEISKLEI